MSVTPDPVITDDNFMESLRISRPLKTKDLIPL